MSVDLLELFFRTTVDYGVIVLDSDGIVTRWNPGAERMFGWAAAEIVGTRGHDIFVEPDRRAGMPLVELRTATEQGRAEDERWHLRKDGSRFWASGVMVSLREGGELQGYVKVVRDFTERRRLDEAVRETQKLESIGVLAAGVAHDFNNVLTAIIGNLSLARGAHPDASVHDVAGYLADAERASQRAVDLVKQLLNYAGKGRREVRPVDVARVVGDTISIVRASVSPKIRIRLDAPASVWMQADPGQVQQLVLNLVLNAAEAIGDTTGDVRIRLRIREIAEAELRERYLGFPLPPRAYTEIVVHDTGQGMDPATLKQIFDPFFTTKFLGRGLGLAAALGIVRSHGGGIAVESEPNRGSTFTVVLPAEQDVEVPRTVPEAIADAARGDGLVLVVDDEPAIRSLVQRSLENLGYTVLLAEHGGQALELLTRTVDPILLVVLDLAMPVLDGAETAAALHQRWPELPVLVMSGLADHDALRSLERVRIAGFVPKPFAPEQLAQAVALALGKVPI
ncbi:MAG TPA: response regulator [Gemmatimonadales bacterium]|nr:response regulator [Gemmatimonadales bacterium]